MLGVKGRSGRKKLTVNSYNAYAHIERRLPELLEVIMEKAIGHRNLEAAIYLVDRRMGRPRQ